MVLWLGQVADEGGGVPRSDLPLLWTFFYTTAPPDLQVAGHGSDSCGRGRRKRSDWLVVGGQDVESLPTTHSLKDAEELAASNRSHLVFPNVGTEPVLAGHGMGLPLSRIYARCVGLVVTSTRCARPTGGTAELPCLTAACMARSGTSAATCR